MHTVPLLGYGLWQVTSALTSTTLPIKLVVHFQGLKMACEKLAEIDREERAKKFNKN